MSKFLLQMAIMLLSVVTFSVGRICALKPAFVIELQRKFYEKINWKIEPVSMSKELRNTRFMGNFLTLLSLATLLFAFL